MSCNIFHLGDREEIQLFTRKRRSVSSSSQNNSCTGIVGVNTQGVSKPVENNDNGEKPINLIIKNTFERSHSQTSMRDLLNQSILHSKDQ